MLPINSQKVVHPQYVQNVAFDLEGIAFSSSEFIKKIYNFIFFLGLHSMIFGVQ